MNEHEKPVIKDLFISHYDRDHVNGIKEICSRCCIKNIVMAYQHPLNAVLEICADMIEDANLYSGYQFSGESLSMRLNQQQSLIDMISEQNGDINIIQMDSITRLREQDIALEAFPEERLNSAGPLGENLLIDPANSYVVDAPNGKVYVYRTYPKTDDSLILGYYPNFHLICSPEWKLLVIYYLPNGVDYNSICDEFISKLNAALPDLPPDIESPDWTKTMVKYFEDPRTLSEISTVYKSLKISRDLNTISLCLAVAPVHLVEENEDDPLVKSFRAHFVWKSEDMSHYINHAGIFNGSLLLTGDSKLQADCGGGKSYCQNIADLMQQNGFLPISVVLIPHYGSKMNIDTKSFSILTKDCGCSKFVVSYGKNNSYGHPNKDTCWLFGSHIFTLHRDKENWRVFPEKFDGLCSDEFIRKGSATQPIAPLINNCVMHHCHDKCSVEILLEDLLF